jgi:hypothetical protein
MHKEKKFEEKFNFLLQEISTKFKLDNTNPIEENDNEKIYNTSKYLERQMSRYCLLEKNELIKFSSNFNSSDLENLENTYSIKGKKKEYNIAMKNFENCLKPFKNLKKDLNSKKEIIELITNGSFDICVNNVKDNVKNLGIGENLAREKLENCYEGLILGRETNKKLINSIVDNIKITL